MISTTEMIVNDHSEDPHFPKIRVFQTETLVGLCGTDGTGSHCGHEGLLRDGSTCVVWGSSNALPHVAIRCKVVVAIVFTFA